MPKQIMSIYEEVSPELQNAVNVLGFAIEELSPQYKAAAELLDRRLGSASINAALHSDTQERESNVEMLRGVMSWLPAPVIRGEERVFEVNDIKEFSVTNSSVLWVPETFTYRPTYIIGERLVSEGMPIQETRRARKHPSPVLQLLLWVPKCEESHGSYDLDLSYSHWNEDHQLTTAYVYNHEYRALEQKMFGMFTQGTQEDVYNRGYSHRTRTSDLTSRDGFKLLGLPHKPSPLDFDGDVNNPEDLDELYSRMNGLRGVLDHNRNEFKNGITNETLQKFDVIRHVASLAMRFDVLEQVGRRVIDRFDDK